MKRSTETFLPDKKELFDIFPSMSSVMQFSRGPHSSLYGFFQRRKGLMLFAIPLGTSTSSLRPIRTQPGTPLHTYTLSYLLNATHRTSLNTAPPPHPGHDSAILRRILNYFTHLPMVNTQYTRTEED